MTPDPLKARAFALELLEHIGVEPRSPEEIAAAGALREQLEKLAGLEQPAPRPTEARPVWELVVEDMHARDRVGRHRYGVPLQAGNGRDALRDAYEEALDLVVYLRQVLEERRDRGDG